MATRLRVLLLEDDVSLREAITLFLSVNFHLVGMATLAGARTALRNQEWDVVLLDQKLPDGDGLSLMEDIRQLGARPWVIVLTGSDDRPSAQKAVAAGADDYIVKTENLFSELSIRIPLGFERMNQRLAAHSEYSASPDRNDTNTHPDF